MTEIEIRQKKPRLVPLLGIFLLLEAVVLVIIGLNLFTDDFAFLGSWNTFTAALREAFQLVTGTPGDIESSETLLYDVIAAVILVITAGASLIAGGLFFRASAFAWILSLLVQISTLILGIALYWIYKPNQVYALLVVGALMVFYLNNTDVREWFLYPESPAEEGRNG
jgi:hypothetical protein